MNQIKKIHRKEADLFLVIGIIAVAVIIYACVKLFSPAGAVVVVNVNGEETARFPLDRDTTCHIEGVDGGYNELCISEGAAYLTDADCPDKLCQSQGRITKAGESIICLPHRVAVIIEDSDRNADGGRGDTADKNKEEEGVDTIAK